MTPLETINKFVEEMEQETGELNAFPYLFITIREHNPLRKAAQIIKVMTKALEDYDGEYPATIALSAFEKAAKIVEGK